MNLNEKIEKDYIDAYKTKDALKLSVLRLVKTAIKNKLVEQKRPHDQLSDAEALDVLLKQAKQRQDSIEQYRAAKRPDLEGKEQAELEILRQYLPKALSEEEIDAIIQDAVNKTGAKDVKDMGKVMGLIMEECKGRIDGKAVSAKIRARLS